MSRRLLTLGGGGSGFVPVDPPDPDPDALSTAWHGEHTLAMQPEWDYVLRVGPTREHTTLLSALTAARQKPYARLGQAGGNRWVAGIRAGFARTVIVLDPGTYEAADVDGADTFGIQIGQGIDLMGNGDSRDDVLIYTATSRYNVNPWGTFYLANLTLHHAQGPTGNNYCMHGSTPEEGRDFTSIIDNVAMLDTNTGSSGICGWDMPEGTRAFMYRCRFESTTGHGNVIHEMAGSDNEGLFLECESDVPLVVGHSTGASWVVDCTELDGTPIPNSAVVDMVTVDPPTGIPTDLPVDGFAPADAAKYAAGIEAADVEMAPAFPSVTNLSGFTPGRTYYIPLIVPKSCRVGGARLEVVTAAGSVAAGAVGGKATPGYDSGFIVHGDSVTAVAGDITRPPHANDQWLPAGAKVWLAVRVNNASCVVKGSATMAATTQCYYTDDAAAPTTGGISAFVEGLTALPSGSAVPWVALVTG